MESLQDLHGKKSQEVGVARIPDAELARLKAEVSVQRLVEGC
ncbi:MAG: hypothetical protein ACK5MT_18625 [Actinomycetales bacterium]